MEPHQHCHHHHHHDPDTDAATNSDQTLGEANRKYFDFIQAFDLLSIYPGFYSSAASTNVFDQEWVLALSFQITTHLQSQIEWLGLAPKTSVDGGKDDSTVIRLLDYACGNGLVAKALEPFVDEIRGIDVSAVMVELFNKTASQLGLAPQKMRAIQGNVMEPSSSSSSSSSSSTEDVLATAEFQNFDLIVMSLALHHVSDPAAMLRRLTGMLRAGSGRLVIIDWALDQAQDDGSDVVSPQLSSEIPVAYDGFNRAQMTRLLQEAGCSDIDYQLHPELLDRPPMGSNRRHLFFARGGLA